jgi:acetyl esterase/lipase
MNQIVEDAMGALLWIKEHIKTYKGDPDKIAVTGDSAGGHLAAMVVFGGKMLETDGYAEPTLGFHPTYLPKELTAEQVAAKNGLSVKAAIFSYAACKENFETPANFFWSFAQATPRGIFGKDINVTSNPEHYKKVSPVYIIPAVTDQKLPVMLCIVGSKGNLITPASVKSFIEKLNEKGHKAEYWEHKGRPHAFLDSKRNEFLGTEFRKDAIAALDKMITFLDTVLK